MGTTASSSCSGCSCDDGTANTDGYQGSAGGNAGNNMTYSQTCVPIINPPAAGSQFPCGRRWWYLAPAGRATAAAGASPSSPTPGYTGNLIVGEGSIGTPPLTDGQNGIGDRSLGNR